MPWSRTRYQLRLQIRKKNIADIANPKLATNMVNMRHILMNFSWVGRGTWKNYITILAKTYTIKLLKQGLQYP